MSVSLCVPRLTLSASSGALLASSVSTPSTPSCRTLLPRTAQCPTREEGREGALLGGLAGPQSRLLAHSFTLRQLSLGQRILPRVFAPHPQRWYLSCRPSLTPPRSSSEGPPPPRRPRNYDHQNPVSSTGVQLRDNLDNIYDLVFELRQEVDDLHFRLHSTNAKVATLLQLLASMSEAFPSHQDGATSEEMPHAATGEGDVKGQSAKKPGLECTSCRVEKADSATRQQQLEATEAERAMDNLTEGMIWDSEPTYIEEEPWLGDLSATGQSYQPGV